MDSLQDDKEQKKIRLELEELLRYQIENTTDALKKARLIGELKALLSDNVKRSVILDSQF